MSKVALVTGAASGLGEAIARRFVADGMTVVLADIDIAGGEALAEELGDQALFVTLDVRSEEAWLTALGQIRKRFGTLHVLVNNAGVTTVGTIEELSFEAFRHELDIDLCGPFLGCKHALPLMKSEGGSIINMSSAAGLRARADLLAYNTAKAGVTMLTKALALHCAKSGYAVRVNSVHPGAIRTPILEKVMAQVDDPAAMLAGIVAEHPVGYLGSLEDVTAIVAYLASEASPFVTGAQFVVDGGMSL